LPSMAARIPALDDSEKEVPALPGRDLEGTSACAVTAVSLSIALEPLRPRL
jgi:hypothetical protein